VYRFVLVEWWTKLQGNDLLLFTYIGGWIRNLFLECAIEQMFMRDELPLGSIVVVVYGHSCDCLQGRCML